MTPLHAQKVATTQEIDDAIANQAAVAVGVSGGKDSQACALAIARHLDAVGHAGPRVLVHASLGALEWRESLPVCQRIADHVGWDLIVVRRNAGDLLQRWQKRWQNNRERYENLSCVRLILPFSTPTMRFCTSELKVDQITAELRRRFPNKVIVNASGIRAEESASRAKMPVSAPMAKLSRKGFAGISWHPILHWQTDQVWKTIHSAGLEPHHAYSEFGSSRVSCVFCIMASLGDLEAALRNREHREVYVELVRLEIESTFGFQGHRWLADMKPDWLPEELRVRVPKAKRAAEARQLAESRIPTHLLFTQNWPSVVPTNTEAQILADVRREVCEVVGLQATFTTPDEIIHRYRDLLEQRGCP